MDSENSNNILFFENDSMRGLFEDMATWQLKHKDGANYCCICLTNPSEIRLVGTDGHVAEVSPNGSLWVCNIS